MLLVLVSTKIIAYRSLAINSPSSYNNVLDTLTVQQAGMNGVSPQNGTLGYSSDNTYNGQLDKGGALNAIFEK